MTLTNRNNNSSQRAGRGLGPCGAGMARGKGAGFRQNAGREMGQRMSQGMGRGQGLGLRRRDGSCRNMGVQDFGTDEYSNDLERRIADLEAENRRLKAEAAK